MGYEDTPSSDAIRGPMPSKKSDDQKLADQANELYWRSGQSVNQIAEAMDLSKSGLYALIRPLPAGGTCPDCGEGLVFPNRTTEQKAIASCPECEYVSEASKPGSEVRPTKRRARKKKAPSTQANGEPVTDLGSELEPRGSTAARKTSGLRRLGSSRVLWASVLLGVAAGLYVTRRSR
jgi:DNA-directed RNA polymerase subunit M/transcription elongation factor TFIIS